jgi:hypothetical protein
MREISQTGYPTSMSTDPNWATSIAKFEDFLKGQGMRLEHREEYASFGSKLFRYAGGSIAVRVVSDKGIWFVEIRSVQAADTQWYDTAIIRELLHGSAVEEVMSLEQQTNFVERDWPAIVRCFDPSDWHRTSTQLSILRLERTKRRNPGLSAPSAQVS